MPQIPVGTLPDDGTGASLFTTGRLINQWGQLSDKTVDAAFYKTAGLTTEAALNLAIPAAALLGTGAAVWVPASLLPYNASLVTFNPAVRMIREGSAPNIYDVVAYGANGDGITNNAPAWQACFNGLPIGTASSQGAGGIVWVPNPATGYKFTSGVTVPSGAHIMGESQASTIITGFNGTLFTVDGSLAAKRYIVFENLMFAGVLGTSEAFRFIAGANGINGVTIRNVWMDSWDTCITTTQAGSGTFFVSVLDCFLIATQTLCYNFSNNSNALYVARSDHRSTLAGGRIMQGGSSNLGYLFMGCVFEGPSTVLDLQAVNGCAFEGCDFENVGASVDHYIGVGLNAVQANGFSMKGCQLIGNASQYIAFYSVLNADIAGNCWSGLVPRWSSQPGGAGNQNIRDDDGVMTLTDAATIATNLNGGGATGKSGASVGQVTVAGNRTMGAPSNAVAGKRFTWTIIQDGVGGRTVNFATNFPKFSWSDTGNTLGKRSSITGYFDGTNWNQDGAQTPYA